MAEKLCGLRKKGGGAELTGINLVYDFLAGRVCVKVGGTLQSMKVYGLLFN